MNKNQYGFSAVEGLLLYVIVGLIGFLGWYVWHSNYQTNTNSKEVTVSTKDTANTAPYTDALKLVQDTYNTTSAYIKRTTNADQGEIDSVKSKLSGDLYISMSNYLKNQTDSGRDQFTCAQMAPESYKIVAGTVSDKTVPIFVNQKYDDTVIKVTYTVDMTNLKITAITCPQ